MRAFLFLLAGVTLGVVGSAPAWAAEPSRMNGRIVFETDGGMASMSSDGTGTIGLRSARVGQVQPSWSSDGTTIVYAAPDGNFRSIFASDPDGTNVRRMVAGGYLSLPALSPDGKWLVYNDGDTLFRTNAVAGASRGVELVNGSSASWSPDGRSIAYTSWTESGSYDLYVLELASSRVTRLTNTPTAEYEPDWSPSGDRILFSGEQGGQWSLFTIRPDRTGRTQITEGDAFDPVWSPDGTLIAFVRGAQIWVARNDGGDAHQLTNEVGWTGSPAWQPLSPGPVGCTQWGTDANDLLVGTFGNDVLCGFAGNDSLLGLQGQDTLRGNEGDDWLAGGTGTDLLRGGAGDDVIDARDAGTDMLFGDAGFDVAKVDAQKLDAARLSTEIVSGSRNIAAWHPTTTSNDESTNPAFMAVDDRYDDFWSSGGYASQWIEVDLLAARRVASLRLIAHELPAQASMLVLGRGPNESAYRLLHAFQGPTVFQQALSYTPKHPWRRIRYVRLQVPAVPNVLVGWIALPELEVYAAKP
jgi:hemolysin type calcium-binding protein/WD40 repeat protein